MLQKIFTPFQTKKIKESIIFVALETEHNQNHPGIQET